MVRIITAFLLYTTSSFQASFKSLENDYKWLFNPQTPPVQHVRDPEADPGGNGGSVPPQEWEKGKGSCLFQAQIQQHTSMPGSNHSFGDGILPPQVSPCAGGLAVTVAPQQRQGSVPRCRARPAAPRPCPAAWARPLAKLSSWFVTVGLSCVRCSGVGDVVCSVVVRGEGRRGHPRTGGGTPQGTAGAGGTGWPKGHGDVGLWCLDGVSGQAGPGGGFPCHCEYGRGDTRA